MNTNRAFKPAVRLAIAVLPFLLAAAQATASNTAPCEAAKNPALCTTAQAPAIEPAVIAAEPEFAPPPVEESIAPVRERGGIWSDRIRSGESHPVRGSARDRRIRR